MSGLAGIFKFDPRDRVDGAELMELAAGIGRIGPDGGGEHISQNLGMAYRAFHTTPESHFENQPLARGDCVLTWDGRLDIREELRHRISRKLDVDATDVELVLACYKEWGAACFAELMGDWSLALWDERRQELILARDYIGVRRLFYRLDEDGVSWCSLLEPLVLLSRRKLRLDLGYLAGFLYARPPIESTPYGEIRSVLPSHTLRFRVGSKPQSERYWALNPLARIHYASDTDYERHFREIFRESVHRRLRSDRAILAELSGGLDSSSIVCIADDILSESPGVPVETLSIHDPEEPSGDERPYFSLVEQRRGRVGHRISKSDFARWSGNEMLPPLPDECFAASPGYFAQSFRWASLIDEIETKTGSRVTLSGTGGDEILGGVQYEAPELAEYLAAGKLISVARSLYGWSLARNKTVFELLGDAFFLLRARRDPQTLVAVSDRTPPWILLEPSVHHSSLPQFTAWQSLSPTQLTMEWIRYNLASQLTCSDPPLVGVTEKRYPYLDRGLYTFLASIPRTQVLQANRRRHLMRRALNGIVPDGVLFRKTKWFGFRSILAHMSSQAKTLDNLLGGEWLSDKIVVNAALVKKSFNELQHGASPEAVQLLSAVAIEQWLRLVSKKGYIELTSDLRSCASATHCAGMLA